MKKILSILLLTLPFLGFGQSMNISWEDRDGREFSINTHTGNFKYSMVSGDQLEYNNGYSSYDTGEKGTLRSVGGLKVEYNNGYSSYDKGPKGTIRGTSGSVY